MRLPRPIRSADGRKKWTATEVNCGRISLLSITFAKLYQSSSMIAGPIIVKAAFFIYFRIMITPFVSFKKGIRTAGGFTAPRRRGDNHLFRDELEIEEFALYLIEGFALHIPFKDAEFVKHIDIEGLAFKPLLCGLSGKYEL